MLQQGNHYWTGVKTEGQLILPGTSNYELMAEILTLQYSKDYSKVASQTSLEYIFDPDTYGMKDPTLLIESYSMELEKLQEYGIIATKLRKQLVERSQSLKNASDAQSQDESDVNLEHIKQLPRKYVSAKEAGYSKHLQLTYDEMRSNSIPYKARRRRLNTLSTKEIRAVHDAVNVDKLTHASAAIKFSICIGTVRKIVRSFKVKYDFLQELLDKQSHTEAKFTAATNTI